MVVLPMIVTLLSRRHPAAILTSGPMTQNGPISTSSSISAEGSTTACGERFGIESEKNRKLNRLDSQRARGLFGGGGGGGPSAPLSFGGSSIRNIILHRLRIDQHELYVGLTCELVFYEGLAADVTSPALHAHGDGLEDELIARDHRVPHLDLIHAQQNGELASMFQLL